MPPSAAIATPARVPGEGSELNEGERYSRNEIEALPFLTPGRRGTGYGGGKSAAMNRIRTYGQGESVDMRPARRNVAGISQAFAAGTGAGRPSA